MKYIFPNCCNQCDIFYENIDTLACIECNNKLVDKEVYIPTRIWELIVKYCDRKSVIYWSHTCSELFKNSRKRDNSIFYIKYADRIWNKAKIKKNIYCADEDGTPKIVYLMYSFDLNKFNNFYEDHGNIGGYNYYELLMLYRSYYAIFDRKSNFENENVMWIKPNYFENSEKLHNALIGLEKYNIVEFSKKWRSRDIQVHIIEKELLFKKFIEISPMVDESFYDILKSFNKDVVSYRCVKFYICNQCEEYHYIQNLVYDLSETNKRYFCLKCRPRRSRRKRY